MRHIDLTERLSNLGRPTITVAEGVDVEVNNSAKTMLKVLAEVGDDMEKVSPSVMMHVYELIFSKSDRAKIDGLGLCWKDFMLVIETAMNLISGADEVGEA